MAGGNGAVGFSNSENDYEGGQGGGGFTLYAKNALNIDGTINANGTQGFKSNPSGKSGPGGGAGGFFVFATESTITGTGTVNANGAQGSPGSLFDGGGGGGGGGYVHYIHNGGTPTITTNVDFGLPGSGVTSGTNTGNGGGGGAMGGDGGSPGFSGFSSSAPPSPGTQGQISITDLSSIGVTNMTSYFLSSATI